MVTKEMQRYLTPAQAADYIGASVSYLAKARSEGNRDGHTPGPPYSKIGKVVRYDLEDLDDWIRANKVTG